jgi:hypothetical protein
MHEGGEHWKKEIELNGSRQSTVMSVWAELPDGGEFPNGETNRTDGFFEQEGTEETEVFFRALFSLCAPVQKSCADNRNKGN